MYKYYVANNKKLTPTTLLLTLKKDPAEKTLSFQPGQYAAISFKKKGRPTPARCFSIVNSPTDEGTLQCSIRTKGKFTRAVASLDKGDEVNVRGSFGGFVFDPERDRDAVLIAGGIGIAPFMSMIQYATATNLSNNITLIYACNNQDDVPFFEQLKILEKHNSHLRITYVISKGQIDKFLGYNVKTGRITPEIVSQAVDNSYSKKSFFICGPSLFMNAMSKELHQKGISSEKIMTEAFSQGPNSQTGKIRSWPFNIYAFGVIGIVLTSFIVMLNDLLKTLPTSNMFGSNNLVDSSSSTNNRQAELDKLVNGLPALPSNGNSTTTSTSNPTSVKTTTSAPKCTTTQSGVTTCV